MGGLGCSRRFCFMCLHLGSFGELFPDVGGVLAVLLSHVFTQLFQTERCLGLKAQGSDRVAEGRNQLSTLH